MLFNSYEFIFFFLPTALYIFFWLGRRDYHQLSLSWLVLISLLFYAWWNPTYLGLLLISIFFNYLLGITIIKKDFFTLINVKWLLSFGIIANIIFLGYFKYYSFIIKIINDLFIVDFDSQRIILPLAISFFTFTQIAYLVDASSGEIKDFKFLNYCLFVTFFPHLIAGPIVHYREIAPYFKQQYFGHFDKENINAGLTMFSLGLFKKVIFADNLSTIATPVFDVAANTGMPLTLLEAWFGVLAYSLQLYFDFSGYSDMAIGIAQMFGVKFPLNFNSPYKAASIIEFWRRWHITVSDFLRDYIYIPLGGNRKGELRRYFNLMLTMLLGGLWHGAGWNFVLWGGLHGFYLVINHKWRTFQANLGNSTYKDHWWSCLLGRIATFLAVVVAWVFFRAKDVDTSIVILKAMFGMNGISLPVNTSLYLGWLHNLGIQFNGVMPSTGLDLPYVLSWLLPLLFIAFIFPNTQEWLANYYYKSNNKSSSIRLYREKLSIFSREHQDRLRWQPSYFWGIVIGCLNIVSILSMSKVREFIYFQF